MSTLERIAWLDEFQATYETGGWFNNIRGILRVAHERGVDGPWFSSVDAYILEAISRGKAAQLGHEIAHNQNPGIALWQQFFVAQTTEREVVSAMELRRIWGVAEQTATDYGRSQAGSLSRTMQDEIVLTGFGNAYRQAVSDPTGARILASVTATAAANAACVAAGPFSLGCQVVASPIASVVAVHIADELSDPRNEWAAYQFTHWLYDANWPAQYVALP